MMTSLTLFLHLRINCVQKFPKENSDIYSLDIENGYLV